MTRLQAASTRLDKALRHLEGALDTLLENASEPGKIARERAVMIADRDRLAAELDAALEREKYLEGLADEASTALGSAIAEVRAALVQSDDREPPPANNEASGENGDGQG